MVRRVRKTMAAVHRTAPRCLRRAFSVTAMMASLSRRQTEHHAKVHHSATILNCCWHIEIMFYARHSAMLQHSFLNSHYSCFYCKLLHHIHKCLFYYIHFTMSRYAKCLSEWHRSRWVHDMGQQMPPGMPQCQGFLQVPVSWRLHRHRQRPWNNLQGNRWEWLTLDEQQPFYRGLILKVLFTSV